MEIKILLYTENITVGCIDLLCNKPGRLDRVTLGGGKCRRNRKSVNIERNKVQRTIYRVVILCKGERRAADKKNNCQ